MVQIRIFNNLTQNELKDDRELTLLSQQLLALTIRNIYVCNRGSYDSDSLELLLKNKNIDAMYELLKKSYIVILIDEYEAIIGCGLITNQDERYFEKTLHVMKEYQGFGYAKLICEAREKFFKENNIMTSYIESLKFEDTIKFHEARGYVKTAPYRALTNTILMKRELTYL